MLPSEDMFSLPLLSLDSPHQSFPKLSLSLHSSSSRYSPGFDDSAFPSVDLLSTASPWETDRGGVLFETFNSPQTKGHLDHGNRCHEFWASRSRVIRLHNFRSLSAVLITGFLHQERTSPTPMTIWALREEYKSAEDGRFLYCVYRTHEEASQTLSLPSSPMFSVAPALETDLEPFHKLRRIDFKQMVSGLVSGAGDSPSSAHHILPPVISFPPPSPCKLDGVNTIRQSSSFSDFRELSQAGSTSLGGSRVAFPISSNPPNAKSNFRLGDWICNSPVCGAHNFGRNVVCIGCGSSRPTNVPAYFGQTPPGSVIHPPRFPSPRFAGVGSSHACPQDATIQFPVPQRCLSSAPVSEPPQSTSPYPILTPSGKQLSIGGKVQNISMNPLAPCFMFWSFNEPLPHPGQIRPTISVSLQHPPILNTGNRGPIEHQPGDWICHKCNYLNWRRRKVCQTCYPYAEGNGDSISAAVQAERIALLANVLSSPVRDSHSLPPSPSSSSFSSGATSSLAVGAMHNRNSALSRSRSHTDLFQNHHGVEKPIYQTSDAAGYLSTPGPLLPAFLQDIVHSPTLSPASSASADFSSEDYDDVELSYPPRHYQPLSRKASSSLTAYSIWKLDGEEARALSGHSQEDLR